LPLVVYVQGSGCHSLFRVGPDGRIRGRYQNILLNAGSEEVRVLAVEKPGVSFLDDPKQRGTAELCSKQFLEEHTLDRWSSAIDAAIKKVRASVAIHPSGMLLIGHSEGGIVAARLAASDPSTTHIALVASNGPTQLFDLAWKARQRQEANTRQSSMVGADPEEIYAIFQRIQADPHSIEKFAWGHPFRRWSSFLSTSTLDELLKSRTSVFMAHWYVRRVRSVRVIRGYQSRARSTWA
jgi:pimeloyl-ACP methyl ester carboxylesterase